MISMPFDTRLRYSDTLTEMEVSKALQKLGVNRTRIIVAHRLSTIMNVDKIVVILSGRKVEEGSFEELISKKNGIFRGMWERQQRKESESKREEHMDDGSMFVMNVTEPYAGSDERQSEENAENEEVWHETVDH